MKLIDENFMLHGDTARFLYHSFAEKLPIIDYHCHLDAAEIAGNHKYNSITELMLGRDHYKWRFMRSGGIDEYYITGEAPEREKFKKWASVLPFGIGNPLYHWTHLELLRYFGIDECLNEKNADGIYDACNFLLSRDDFRSKALINKSNVAVICTTDDPSSSLEHHSSIAGSGFKTKVLPTFRPDSAINISAPAFIDYVSKSNTSSYESFVSWLISRIDYFHAAGCRLSDHGFETVPYAVGNASAVFEKRMNGGIPDHNEDMIYRTDLSLRLAREYAKRGWTMQLHMGATRNNNTAMLNKIGRDTGFDAINDLSFAEPLSRFLDSLESDDLLPKTILYTLNPKDNYMLGAMIGNFQKGPVVGKLQLGSGWWFCDQRDGMESQLKALGNLGMLGSFVGMLTDSRSFVSYPRHEYFRRILCNLIGNWVDSGEYPADMYYLEKIISGICYNNALSYFNF